MNLPGSSRHFPILVTRAQQVGGKVVKAQFFAGVNAAGRGINARCILKNLAGQLLVDHMAELDIVISEDRSSRQKQAQGHGQEYDSGSRGPEARGDSNPQSISPL